MAISNRHGTKGFVTCDIWGGGGKYSDVRHRLSFNLTCDVGDNSEERDTTLPFLKIHMQHCGPPSQGPPLLSRILSRDLR